MGIRRKACKPITFFLLIGIICKGDSETMSLTLNMKELQEKWMKFYMNIMVLMSNDLKAVVLLDKIKLASAEYNEKIMKFFEEMEAKPSP